MKFRLSHISRRGCRGVSRRLGSLHPTTTPAANMALVCICVWVRMHLISNDGAHTLTEAAVVVAPVGVARDEVEAVGVVRVVWVLRRRPVAAVLTSVAEVAAPAVASSGKKNTIAIRSSKLSSFNPIQSCPLILTIIN